MKVRLLLDVGDYERLVIAKYWAPVGKGLDRTRTRATRAQVRRFVLASLRSAVKEYVAMLPERSRTIARKLADRTETGEAPEVLREPQEKQPWLAL